MIDDRPPRTPRFVLEAVAYGMGSAATAIVSVIAVPVLTRLLDPSSYGSLDLFTTLLSILTVVAQLGLASALILFYRRAQTPTARADIAQSGLAMVTAVSCALGIGGAVLFAGASSVLQLPAVNAVAGILTFLWLPVNVIGATAQDLLRAQFRARAYAFLSVARAAFATLLGIVLVAAAGLGIAGVIGAQVIVGAIFTIFALVLVRDDLHGTWRGAEARRMLKFGLPLVPAGIAAWVLVFSNRYFLLRLASLEEVGIYAVAARVAAVMTVATVGLNAAWLPFAVQESSKEAHRVTYARLVAVIAAALFIVAIGLGLLAPEILVIAAPPAYADAAEVVGLLSLGTAIGALATLVAIGLQLTEHTMAVAKAVGLAAGISLGLNLMLVPGMGALGAAWATVAAMMVQFAATFLMAQRHYPVPYPTASLVACAAVALGVVSLGLASTSANGGAGASLALRIGLLVGGAATIAGITFLAVRSLRTVPADDLRSA